MTLEHCHLGVSSKHVQSLGFLKEICVAGWLPPPSINFGKIPWAFCQFFFFLKSFSPCSTSPLQHTLTSSNSRSSTTTTRTTTPINIIKKVFNTNCISTFLWQLLRNVFNVQLKESMDEPAPHIEVYQIWDVSKSNLVGEVLP